MHCIVGLGNPGGPYEQTRHNAGFMAVETAALKWDARFVPGTGEYWYAICAVGGVDTALIKPSTYMNNSGVAVLQAMERFQTPPRELLIVFDDFHLPLGRLRLRPSGSDGGHRGLESVIYHLQSDEVPRLRFGIAPQALPEDRDGKVDFVLEPFDPGEIPALKAGLIAAADAIEMFVVSGITAAMNTFNGKAPLTGDPEPQQM